MVIVEAPRRKEVYDHFTLYSPLASQPEREKHGTRALVTMQAYVGDAVIGGLAIVDEIYKNDPTAKIDVIANKSNADFFMVDPRVNSVLLSDSKLFPDLTPGAILRALHLSRRTLKEAREFQSFLQKNDYDVVFPMNLGYRFYQKTYPHSMSFVHLAKRFLQKEKHPQERPYIPVVPASQVAEGLRRLTHGQTYSYATHVRQMVDRYFGDAIKAGVDDPIPLYISPDNRTHGQMIINEVRKTSGKDKVLTIAPDTSSWMTRLPKDLVTDIVTRVITQHKNTAIYILPSYSDEPLTSKNLQDAIQKALITRGMPAGEAALVVQRMPQEIDGEPSRPNLLDVAGIIDATDAFLCGDTSLYHLGVAEKRIYPKSDLSARNHNNIYALFGATSPSYYGHPAHSLIPDTTNAPWQRKIYPGLFKELYPVIHPRRNKKPQLRPDFFAYLKNKDAIQNAANVLTEMMY